MKYCFPLDIWYACSKIFIVSLFRWHTHALWCWKMFTMTTKQDLMFMAFLGTPFPEIRMSSLAWWPPSVKWTIHSYKYFFQSFSFFLLIYTHIYRVSGQVSIHLDVVQLFISGWYSILNSRHAAGIEREGGFAGFLDILLYKLYACVARPGVPWKKIC